MIEVFTDKCYKGKLNPIGIVIHYTAWGDASETVAYFQKANASAHYVISRSGTVFQCVKLEDAAWHAGKSSVTVDGKQYKNLNLYTFGIELANWGLLKKNQNGDLFCWPPLDSTGKPRYWLRFPNSSDSVLLEDQYWESFPEKQIFVLAEICRQLMTDFQIHESKIWAHSEVSLSGKVDPGPAFPWEHFFELLVGNWQFKDEDERFRDLSQKQGDRRDC